MTRSCPRKITATVTFDLHPDYDQADLFSDAPRTRHEPLTVRGAMIYCLENEESGVAQFATTAVVNIREE